MLATLTDHRFGLGMHVMRALCVRVLQDLRSLVPERGGGAIMAAVRTTCLRCALAAAEAQDVADDPRCSQCGTRTTFPFVLTPHTSQAAVSVALFKRLSKPRAIVVERVFVANICSEQLEHWRRPTWREFRTEERRMSNRSDYILTKWEDVQTMCNFHLVAAPLRGSFAQGFLNVRATDRGELGIIVPPLVISHR